MQKKKIPVLIMSVLLVVSLLLPHMAVMSEAVDGTSGSSQGNILVTDYEIRDKLYTKALEQIYDGTYVEVDYENTPKSGYNYLLVKLEIVPNGSIGADDFIAQIGKQSYPRVLEDSFLSDHNYAGLGHQEIITKTSGWIVFEIPQSAEGPETWKIVNGRISANLQQTDKNLVQQEVYNGFAARQTELVAQYQANFAKGAYTPENPYVIVNPYETAPLTALILFNTDMPVEVTTTVVGKTDRTSITHTVSGYETYHEIPVIGLYNGENTVKMVLKDQTGQTETYTLQIKTEDMPNAIKNMGISLNLSQPDKLCDGLYIVSALYRMIIDLDGEIRGYFPKFNVGYAAIDEISDQGHIFGSSEAYTNYAAIYEFDAMGFVYREMRLPTPAHHDALLVNDSTLLTLDCTVNLETGEVSDGIPWEDIFNSANGSAEVRTYGDKADWEHKNTVSWCGDDAILISSRNQHAVAKLSYPDFEVEWILSVNPNASPWNADKYLTPVGDDFEWFYSQHHVQLKSEETYDGSGVYEITLFDNGVQRGLDPNASYPESEMYSRMVCYRIDENNMTVEQVWDYGKEMGRELLSAVHGSTQYIPESDSYLGNFDVLFSIPAGGVYDGLVYPTRIMEVTEDGEIILDIELQNEHSYRAEKVTSELLYSAWEGLGAVHGKYIYVGNDVVKYEDTAIRNESVLYRINSISATQNYLNIIGWAARESALSGGYTAAKLVLTNQDTGDAYMYQMDIDAAQRYNSDAPEEITSLLGPYTGFSGSALNISTLAEGDYQISILACQNGNEYRVDTEKVLRIASNVTQVASEDILTEQNEVSSALMNVLDSGKYTLSNPHIAVDPYNIAPLSAIVSFKTPKPATISITVEGKNGAAPLTQQFETMTTKHQIPVYGLYEGEATEVTLNAKYRDGTTSSATISITGNTLPDDFVPVGVVQADTTQMANGWTFFMAGSLQGYVYAIDEAGSVRWIFTEKGLGAASVFLPLENGNYLVGGDKSFGQYYKYSLFEIDLTGHIVHEYMIDGYHHDAEELPSGNLLLLANNINGQVVEDTLYEVDRETGAILRTWDFNAYFNVGNYNESGQHVSDINYGTSTSDWLHINGIDYNEQTNSLLISSRHQDAVFSMDLGTGEINWILSNPNDLWPQYLADKLLTPADDNFEWQYGQHNAIWLPNGDIMLFDNGDYRSKTSEDILDAATQSYSRAVIYHINQQDKTVSQVWEFGKDKGYDHFSAYISSVQYLGEDHYLIDFGGIVKNAAGEATYNIMDGITGSSRSEVYEIKNGTIVFHANVSRSGLHANTFRAVRLTPYASTQELDLSVGGDRLGSLYRYNDAEPISFDSSSAITGGPNVNIVDNGVQLTVEIDPNRTDITNPALVFVGETASYRVTFAAGSGVSYTLNNSELPIGTYRLYLETSNVVYDLELEWANQCSFRPFPEDYAVQVVANDINGGNVYGSGTYYSNTAFTVWAKANAGYQFNGWYLNDTLVSTENSYTLTASQDMVLTAVFAQTTQGGIGDGGTTTIEEGQTVETTNPDGSVTKTVTYEDGSKTDTTTAPNGTSSVVNTDKDGNVSARVTVSSGAINEADGKNEAVALPMPALMVTSDKVPTVSVSLPKNTAVAVEIPVKDTTSGMVAVRIKADGTEEVIKTSFATENGVIVTLSNGETVKIIDNSKSFEDVPAGFWGSDAIHFVASHELFNGTSATTFSPNTNMSRAVIVTLLARLEGVDTNTGSAWYEAGCQWAIESGISDGTNMDGNLTREQLVTMLYRYAGEPAINGSITGFSDVDRVSDWAVDAMTWAVTNGLIAGTNGALNPQGLASRAEAASMLQRFIVNVNR